MKKIINLILFAAVFLLIKSPSYAVSNQDIMDRLDEMQFESDLKEIQRQGNQPYDDHEALFRSRQMLYMGNEMGTDYFIHLPVSHDKKWDTYMALVVTSSKAPRSIQNRTYFSSVLGMSIYCDFPGMRALTATFYSKPGMEGYEVYEEPRGYKFTEDIMRQRPVFAKIKRYVCSKRQK